MNEKSKARLSKLNKLLIDRLEETIGVTVYQDNVSEDEEKNYHYIIYETGGFNKAESKSVLTQSLTVRYISSGRDDLDERTIDMISTLENNNHFFKGSQKVSIQIGDTDSYIDEVELMFTRHVPYGC